MARPAHAAGLPGAPARERSVTAEEPDRRWNGQIEGAHIFSVAQHTLLVDVVARVRWPSLDRKARLEIILLHDAPEYVIGDMISPFKAVIGGAYKAVEASLLAAIHLRFGLPVKRGASGFPRRTQRSFDCAKDD